MLTAFCYFFRNLQAAICSYFEYDQPVFKVPQMSFVKDVTIGEGESVTPSTKFTKTWRLQNSGCYCISSTKFIAVFFCSLRIFCIVCNAVIIAFCAAS